MKKLSKRWIAAGVALLTFLVSSWVFSNMLSTLTPTERWVLRIGLGLLGVTAAGILLWFMRPKDAGVEAQETSGDEAVGVISSARKRMPRGEFDQRPLVLLLGPTSSCKTTVVVKSGLDPELLAGEYTGDDAPTAAVNVWAVRDAILAEAGGALLSDASRWQRIVRAMRAPRVAAAVGRGEVAPRAAVLCVSCDLFYSGGAGEQMETLAQLTRQRLAEAAREFGMKLPVYVLFTKADRIPHYEAWAATFTREEVRVPLGAALPFDAHNAEGAHAERLTPRLAAAFDAIVRSLATRRLELLGREAVGEKRLASYELPREFRKVAVAATKFLTEVTRPTQLGVSPQLRGFYFVGARPVVVRDVASAPAAPAASQAPRASDATAVFARMSEQAAPAPVAASSGPARKVPEWMFLDRFFTDVVLADSGAATAARGGVRVHRLRRAMLGTAIGAAAVAALMFTVSWVNNRSLTSRTEAAAQAVAALPQVTAPQGAIVFPPVRNLRRLDDLRILLDTLHDYEREGAPLKLRMGLWSDSALLNVASPVWLQGFRSQLFTDAWKALVDSLRALPDLPGAEGDYEGTYARLRAYRIITAVRDSSTPEFLAPVLLTSYQRGQPREPDEIELARRQFEHYARLLPSNVPWPESEDSRLVARAQAYLNRFAGEEAIYRRMLADAGKANGTIRLSEQVPASQGILVSTAEVNGAYSVGGWEAMQEAFRNPERYMKGEPWVVGTDVASIVENEDRIIASLRERYASDYAEQWQAFLRSVSYVRASGEGDAGRKLQTLATPTSPLLGLFALIAENTRADKSDSSIAAGFKPVQVVTPPPIGDNLVAESNKAYVEGLYSLSTVLTQLADMTGSLTDTQLVVRRNQVAQGGLDQEVRRAKSAAAQLQTGFGSTAPVVGTLASSLLNEPIRGAEQELQRLARQRPSAVAVRPPRPPVVAGGGGGGGGGASPVDALNAAGAQFCRDLRGITNKYPFNPSVTTEASVSDILTLFQPGTGLLADMQARLEPHLVQRGVRWVPSPNATLAIDEPFLTFFNNASRIANALFPSGATEPRVRVDARSAPSGEIRLIKLTHGGQEAEFNTRTPANVLEWPVPAGSAPSAQLEAEVSGRFGRTSQVRFANESGEWALFRLIGKGSGVWANDELKVTYTEGDRTVVVGYGFAGGPPLMQRGYLGQALNCPTPVVKP